MNPRIQHYKNLSDTIIAALRKRQMDGYYCSTGAEAVALANSFLVKGASVGYGGSMTLAETGMMESLQSNSDITLYGRGQAKDPSELREMYIRSLNTDFYFMSTNAITRDGQLVNIDGVGNRVAALSYGPDTVIILAGMNKITDNVETAIARVHNEAAPPNCLRLERNTPCAVTGVCADCLSPDCICTHTVITRRSNTPGRIKVILIGESYGY
ncbi:MAG: lactate utilization protein [Lachnospiraceae bacterium]|nr:lactate utilization protein [Lachnospiraceae bacterium]MDE7436501.1 lactate utilization protein [Lachnospiraceae bacterium]